MNTNNIEELINTLDLDKLQCKFCGKYFSKKELKKQPKWSKVINLESVDTFICIKCYHEKFNMFI